MYRMDSPWTFSAGFCNCQARAHSWGHRDETVTVKAKKRKELRSYRLVAIASAALAGGFLLWIGMGLGGDGVTEVTRLPPRLDDPESTIEHRPAV